MLNKLKKRFQTEYGKKPHMMYFDGDMERIRVHYEFRHDNKLDEFLIDDITWHDLSMDELFKQINTRLTTSGEQYLYYLLRSPTLKKEEYEKRRELIYFMEENPQFRVELQVLFSRLGRRHGINLHEAFLPVDRQYGKLLLYVILAVLLLSSIIGTLLGSSILALSLVGLVIFNAMYHNVMYKKVEQGFETVNYIVSIVKTAKKLKKLNITGIISHFTNFYDAVGRLKNLDTIAFGIQGSQPVKDEVSLVFTFILNSLFFFDLISYELVKNKIGNYHLDIFNIHETIGMLDASIAVASYRASLEGYSEPRINFDDQADVSLQITDVAHPLVKNPVVNSIDTSMPILLTGSNASGKSTFLRSITMNMIMAQSICTVIATDYKAPAFCIYSSMAIADNLLAGDSYFIAEIKSIKRVVDAISTKHPIFCVIDEILRGTNTIERISASSELLKLMADKKTLCFSATHDLELCELLKEDYRLLHFTETITETGEVVFDYKLRSGPAITRNAIKLLEALGFDKELIASANARASLYGEHKKWY